MKYKANFVKFLLSALLLATTACTQSAEEKAPTDTTPVAPIEEVAEIAGVISSKEVGTGPIILATEVIKNKAGETISDGYLFQVFSETSSLTFSQLESEQYTQSIEVAAKDGIVSFKVRYPNIAGTYRVEVKDPKSQVRGRFFLDLTPGPLASLGSMKTNRYEDTPPFNGVRDANEHWSILGDGVSSTYLTIGPITDAYGNNLASANLKLTLSEGRIVSENPTNISDGLAYFRVESTNSSKLVDVKAESLDDQGNPTLSIEDKIAYVQGALTIEESGAFGNVGLGSEGLKIFTLRNLGTKDVVNITYASDLPFMIQWPQSSCFNKTVLRIQESCTLAVKFSTANRGEFQGSLRIVGSPIGVHGSSLIHPVTANSVAPPSLRASVSEINFGDKKCGAMYQEELYVINEGDLPATGVTFENPPPYPNLSTTYYQFLSPPLDNPMNPDKEALVNCGTSFLAGRKCRVIIRYTPQSLVTTRALQAQIKSGTISLPVVVRGGSIVGDPSGVIPISLITNEERVAGTTFAADNMILNSAGATEMFADVQVGPVKDSCGNNVSFANVNLTATKGTLDHATVSTSSGMANTYWKTSSNIADIGVQSVSATVRDSVTNNIIASGSKSATFRGVNLEFTGVTELGQVLTKKSRIEMYKVKNVGNLGATNLTLSLFPSNQPWFVNDTTYVGGCGTTLAAGAECFYRIVFNTDANFSPTTNNVGNINVSLTSSVIEKGVNTQTLNITGRSEQPPVLSFGSSVYNFGSPPVVAGNPAGGLVTLNNAGPAEAQSLSFTLDLPFVVDPATTTCGTTLAGGASCVVGVKLNQNIKGSYSSQLKAITSYNATNGYSALTTVTSQIVSGNAAGIIPISFGSNAISAIAPATDIISTPLPHGLANFRPVVFSGTTAPGGVTLGTVYYVSVVSNTQFKIYTTSALTTAVNITSEGSGVTYEKVSVPADKTTKIVMNIGPVKDAYGNVVNAGTTVQVSSNAGKLTGDADNDGIINLVTNTQGMVSAEVVSAEFSEIKQFLISAKVLNGATELATGTKVAFFTGAILEFVETTKDFGMVTLGSGVSTRTIDIRNRGNEPITGVNITSSVSGAFSSISPEGTCSSLAPGVTCSVSWVFVPLEATSYLSILTAQGTATGVNVSTMTVTGQGLLPANIIVFDPSSKAMSVGVIPGVTSSGSFKIKNTGNENLNTLSVTASQRNGEFAYSIPAACNTLGLNQECTIGFTFNPTTAVNGTVNVDFTIRGQSVSRITEDILSASIVPAVLSITRPAEQLAADCGAVSVGLRDGNNNAVLAPINLTYTLSRTGPSGGFFSNASCSGGNPTSVTIASGQSNSNTVYYKGVAGTHEIKVSSGVAFSSSANIVILNALTATSNYANIIPSSSATITASGGVSPYTYSVVGGAANGSITSGGVYTAPASTGTYQILVTDSRPYPSPLTYTLSINVVAQTVVCTADIANAQYASRTYNVASQAYGACILLNCNSGYSAYNNQCFASTIACTPAEYSSIAQATAGNKVFSGGSYGSCQVTACNSGYYPNVGTNTCLPTSEVVDINTILVNKCFVGPQDMIYSYSTQTTCQATKNLNWIGAYGTVNCSQYTTSGTCNAAGGCGWFPGSGCSQMYYDVCHNPGDGYAYQITQEECYPRPGVWSPGPETEPSSPKNYFPTSNGSIYFSAVDIPGTFSFFKSDGTKAGTIKIATSTDNTAFTHIAEFQGKVYFNNYDATSGMELWETDGTLLGTKLSKEFLAGSGASGAIPYATSTHLYVFTRNSTTFTGIQATATPNTPSSWVTVSGTASGFTPNIHTNVSRRNVISTKDYLYVLGTTSANGIELFRVSGTTMPTTPIVEYYSGTNSSFASNSEMTLFNYDTNSLLYVATNNGSATRLYGIDGGTSRDFGQLRTGLDWNLLPSNPESRIRSSTGRFYTTLCTAAPNTCTISYIPNSGVSMSTVVSSTSISGTKFFGEVNNKIMFTYYNSTYGSELTSMNLDGSGVTMIQDYQPGLGSSSFAQTLLVQSYSRDLKQAVMGGNVYFGMTNKLMRSNGSNIQQVTLPSDYAVNQNNYVLWPLGITFDKIIFSLYSTMYGDPELYIYRP